MTSISLIIDKMIRTTKEGERESYFTDEIFCLNMIPATSLKGILLPEYLTNLPISRTNCLPNDLSCYTTKYIENLIAWIEIYFDRKVPDYQMKKLKISLHKLWDILKKLENPERWLQKAIQIAREEDGEDIKDIIAQIQENMWAEKLGIQCPTNLDVIKSINNDNLPIYEIKKLELKKIN